MSHSEPTRAATFRADIQGLRAVAVLVVIAAHAGVESMAGGFVGVDVFLVISGFLITRLVVDRIAADEHFSLTGFYARRARRILPVASVVLAAIVAGSVLWLSIIDALDAARDAIWATFFAANIRFADQGVDYFAQQASPSPVQHYWSLAVEEQFYVVWPLLIAACVWWHRRRGRSGPPMRSLAVVLVVITAVSFAWSVHQTAAEPASAYFSTFTRAWELAVGALVALLVHSGHRAGRLRVELLGWTGLVALAASVVSYRESMPFPGTAAVLPVVGTAALLAAGAAAASGPTPGVARLLGLAPLRVVGDWSFSLYLWHWPLLVLPEVRLGRELAPSETAAAIAATFVLSYLTFRFVETPFRTGRTWRAPRRALLLYPASLALVLPVAFAGQAWSEYRGSERGDDPAVTLAQSGPQDQAPGQPQQQLVDPTRALVRASVEAAQEDWPIPSDLTPDLLDLDDDVADVGGCDYSLNVREVCRLGDPDAERVMVVTGDSHARAWIPAFEQIAQQSGYAAYYFVMPQCPAAFVDAARAGTGEPWPECRDFHEWVVDQVTRLEPDLMVVSTSPPSSGVYDDDGERLTADDDVAAELRTGYDDMFRTYRELVGELVLLADVPRLPSEPGQCLSRPGASLGDCLFEPTPEILDLTAVSVAAAQRRGIESIDPTPWLCARGLCPSVIGSTITYRDRGHISISRAAELWQPLGAALDLL